MPTYPTCQLAPLSPSRRVTAPDGSGERRIPAAATKTSNRLDNTKCSCLLFGLGEKVDQSRRTTTLGAIRAEEVGAPVHFSCARPNYIGPGGDMSHGCRISNEFMRIHGGYSWSLHRTETHFSLSPRVASIYCAFLLALLARAERPTDRTHCLALMNLWPSVPFAYRTRI
jgi:hypothetical protein